MFQKKKPRLEFNLFDMILMQAVKQLRKIFISSVIKCGAHKKNEKRIASLICLGFVEFHDSTLTNALLFPAMKRREKRDSRWTQKRDTSLHCMIFYLLVHSIVHFIWWFFCSWLCSSGAFVFTLLPISFPIQFSNNSDNFFFLRM